MATERQTKANRENAKRSTCPKTAAGKARIRYNALKHGLLTKTALLPGDDQSAFRDLSDGIIADLCPVGDMESIIVDRVINTVWRLRRSSQVETGLFVREHAADDEARLWAAVRTLEAPSQEWILDQAALLSPEETAKMKETLKKEAYASAIQAAKDRHESLPEQLGGAFAHDAATGNAFSKLARYETTLHRMLERDLKQLGELQERRAAAL